MKHRARLSPLLLLALLVGLLAGCSSAPPTGVPEEVLVHNILGTSYLGQQKWAEAEAEFGRALDLRAADPLLLNNKAVALLQQGRMDDAFEVLEAALEADPDYPYAHYNMGLIESRRGDFAEAFEHFEAVAAVAPDDLFTQYYQGTSLARLDRKDEAVTAFRKALAANPDHVSSLYGLGRLLIQTGDRDEGTRLITRSQEIRARSGLDEAVGGQYGEQGPFAMGLDYPGGGLAAPAAVEVGFSEAGGADIENPAWTLAPGPEGVTAVVLADGAVVRRLSASGLSEPLTVAAPDRAKIVALQAGDWSNAGTPGLAALLLLPDGKTLAPAILGPEENAFSWPGDAAGTAAGAAALAALDHDHDGDVDLFWCWSDGCKLATNDGSGIFEIRSSGDLGFEYASGGRTPVLAFSDADNDRDTDLLVGSTAGIRLYSNKRDGTFEDVSDRSGLGAALGSLSSLVVADMNKDAWMDLVVNGDDGVRVLHNQRGAFQPPRALLAGAPASAGAGNLVVFDFDNDGFLDVAYSGEERPVILRNLGGDAWEVAEGLFGAASVVDPLAALDVDGDGDLDLFATGPDGVRLLTNEGGNANRWISLGSRGIGDNKFGIGSKVEILSGGLRQKFEITRPVPIHAGLGRREIVQSARYLWPSGVLQDEVELAAGGLTAIEQTDRKGTSCPLLYAWRDGRWSFVTDFLGGCAIGYRQAPGRLSTPDTDEYVLIEGGLAEDEEGLLRLRLNNQLEEVIWFDRVELIAVDHPDGTQVYPNERLMPGPPFPEFRLFASSDVRPILSARDPGSGRDLTERLLHRDRRWVEGFRLLPFKGYAEMHSVEIDLGAFADGQRVVLLLDGWIDYADSTANVAAAQAGAGLVPPRLHVADGRGGWEETRGVMGFPAGLPKTMVLDLSGLFPAADHRLRIDTNMRIYWDRARVMLGGEDTPVEVMRIDPLAAELRYGGFPAETSPDGRKPFGYDPYDVATSSPWKAHVGSYTPFGEVGPLLQRMDDRFVTTKNGDELDLRFPSPGGPASGWTRTYLLYADGFGKDMDPNSAASSEIGPIPFHGMPLYPYGKDVLHPAGPDDDDSRPGRLVSPSPRGWPGARPQAR